MLFIIIKIILYKEITIFESEQKLMEYPFT